MCICVVIVVVQGFMCNYSLLYEAHILELKLSTVNIHIAQYKHIHILVECLALLIQLRYFARESFSHKLHHHILQHP